MAPRYCPHCGKSSMLEDADVGGYRCRSCHRPVHVIELDQVPVDGGKQVKRIEANLARKKDKPADVPTPAPLPARPSTFDKGV